MSVKVNCLNPIAKCGLDLLDDNYEMVDDAAQAEAILVRSASMHEMELSDDLVAVARAGAGVNNIPLDKCAEKGIVVFNTPGANANGVKELVVAAMLLASRDIVGGIEWTKENKDDEGIAKAAEKAKKGAPVNEIIAFVEDWVHSAHVYFATYDLKFAKKSGRVSAVAAFVGELMGLKPILTFDHGKSKVLGKVRGEKAVIPDLIKRAKAEMTPNTPYYILSGDKPEKTEELVKECKKALGGEPQGVYPIGAVISINAGPQVVAVVVKGSQNSN